MATAAATGLTSASTAADAIAQSDAAVAAWRTLPPAPARLDRLHNFRNRLLFHADRELDERDLSQ